MEQMNIMSMQQFNKRFGDRCVVLVELL